MHYFSTICILIVLAINFAIFANTNDVINQEIQHRDQILRSYKNKLTELKQSNLHKFYQYQDLTQKIKIEQQQKSPQFIDQKTPNAIIFISFSMPDLALKQLITEGKQYHIPVVIRGLYKNSFLETTHEILELVQEKNQGGIAINPLWFREFNIQQVPAFVVKHGSDFDVIYGNISLKQALEILNFKF